MSTDLSTASTVPCPHCAEPVPAGANFCEGCGAQLGTQPAGSAATQTWTPAQESPISQPTRMRQTDPPQASTRRPCAECGGEVGVDLYCLQCGTKAPSERDRFAEAPAAWVAGLCDRGIVHGRNEDAMALWATTASSDSPGRAVLVVCDGVSSSTDSDVASLAGARAAREVLRTPLPQGMGTDAARVAAVTKAFTDAVDAANTAVIANTSPDSDNPASATFTAAVVQEGVVYTANVGDSRCYWFPDEGDPVQLTVDDSAAQALIAGGMPRAEAEASAQAHAITKWLGRDSADWSPTVAQRPLQGSGWVLACSDGLWNYASEPTALAERIRTAGTDDPATLVERLVAFANESGGQDNITAAVARVQNGARTDSGAGAAPAAAPTPQSEPTAPPATQERADG